MYVNLKLSANTIHAYLTTHMRVHNYVHTYITTYPYDINGHRRPFDALKYGG